MSWVVTVVIDQDKSNVGTATAVFTDTDSTTLTVTQRATMSLANANAFAAACVSARTTWQSRKTTETNAMNTLVSRFAAAGETADAGVPGSEFITLAPVN